MAEIETEMSSSELGDWMTFYSLEPFGAYRDNLHAGLIAAAVVNPHRKKGTEPAKVTDFLLMPADERRQSELGSALARLAAMAKRKEQ